MKEHFIRLIINFLLVFVAVVLVVVQTTGKDFGTVFYLSIALVVTGLILTGLEIRSIKQEFKDKDKDD